VISVLALLNGATGFFRHLKNALNVIWSVPPAEPTKVRGFLRDTLLSLVAVVGLGIALLLMMVLHGVLFAMLQSLDRIFPNTNLLPLWQFFGGVILFLFTLLMFVLIYKLLPDAEISWKDVWVGALVTAVLFTIGQFLLVLYVTASSIESVYGATSVLIIILTWVYFSAHLLLFGAEFTQVYANQRGSKIVPTQ
jgi:membrane protein